VGWPAAGCGRKSVVVVLLVALVAVVVRTERAGLARLAGTEQRGTALLTVRERDHDASPRLHASQHARLSLPS
jgi:hypothetical protein